MKELKFNLVEWSVARESLPKNATSLQVREYKKKYFKGTAFNTAFPLSNLELPQRWILDGVVETESGEEFEFSWRPDHSLTFTDLILNSGKTWSDSMTEVADGEFAVSIECVARVL